MVSLRKLWGVGSLFVKREDQTDSLYGGNKVRNLEFLLGSALKGEAEEILTLAPLGSNYIAALSAQAAKVNLKVNAEQFVLARNPQIEAHSEFSRSLGARLHLHAGRAGIARATLHSFAQRMGSRLFFDDLYWCPPGATNVLGALGHVNAAVEMVEQVRKGQGPMPDYVVVGAGTCGTIAGLTAAFRYLGLSTRVIGVRCVSALLCHPSRVIRLANRVLEFLGSAYKVDANAFAIVDSPIDEGYSQTSSQAAEICQLFREHEGIILDRTYTAKVAAYLQHWVTTHSLENQSILYWHTFSPAAMNWRAAGEA